MKSIQNTNSYDSFVIFVLMLSVAFLLDQLTFGSSDLQEGNLLAWLSVSLIFLLWLKPKSHKILATLLLSKIAIVFLHMPIVPNHEWFQVFLCLCLLASVLSAYFNRTDRDRIRREKIYELFVPTGKILLLILYFFTALHKLNQGFFSNEDYSCAIALFALTWLPSWLTSNLDWLTVFTEAFIPLSLCYRFTRPIGVYLGFAFHFFLALHPVQEITGFSSMMYCLIFLFIAPNYFELDTNRLFFEKARRTLIPLMLFTVIGAMLDRREITIGDFSRFWSLSVFTFFLLWSLTVLILFILMQRNQRKEMGNLSEGRNNRTSFSHIPNAVWFIIGVLIFNSMTPYLGLKTHTNLSMFSNLQTENRQSNHFLIGQQLKIAGFQDDLVEIVNTDIDALKDYQKSDGSLLITYFEFKRIVSSQKNDFFVDYIRDDNKYFLKSEKGFANYPEVVKPNHWLANKLMSFRPVNTNFSSCQW